MCYFIFIPTEKNMATQHKNKKKKELRTTRILQPPEAK